MSDSDDDELLQMALQEQSQRDLNYTRPSQSRSAKPVVNFVQPPSNHRSAKNPNSVNISKPQHRRNATEDDEDSDLEMLSISSGDEDSVTDQRIGSRNRVKASGKGGGKKDDDKIWVGDEPDAWKRVDEAELGRRVREMRETRTAPITQKFEKKPSVAVKGFNNLQSFSRSMEFVDPLGLGVIDNRTLRLVNEYTASSPSKSEKIDTDVRDKLMYYSEKFDPKLFICRVHQDTTAADLEAGAMALKTDLKGRTQQRKQLVKENFDCFVSCKTTIDDIESKLRRIEEDPEGCGTTQLYRSIQGVTSVANRAFAPLLERQAQAEKIRSVQGMLQRFRTLFNLPSAIRGNISKGEYDLAVREYRKAKSIVLPSHVGILKRVLEEVEKVMQEFKGMLYRSMEDPQIDLTNLENVVRLLLELEPESDPVRHYLNIQNHRIRGLLEKCTFDHETRIENLQNELHEKALLDEKWKKIQHDLNESGVADMSLGFANGSSKVDSQLIDSGSEELDVLRGRYIRRLTAVIIHHIPAFWKVSLSVSSGKFAKVGDEKSSSHFLDEVSGMIQNTISAYESKVHNTFLDLEESNILLPYMSDAITDISKACEAFESKEAAPSVAVAALRTIQYEITKAYIQRLSSWMRASTEEISKNESWVPVSVLERNRSSYTISHLPLAFRSIMGTAMDQIDRMMQSLGIEARKSEDAFILFQETQESVRGSFFNCLLDFAGHLEQIGSELGQNILNREYSSFQNGYSSHELEESFDPLPGSITHPHQKLLMVLSNLGFCKDELSREMHDKYKHIWMQPSATDEENVDVDDLVRSFSGLEEKVLAQYTMAKANHVRAASVNYLLDAGVHWGGAPAVKGVRDASVELLHTLVSVHAEVSAGCKPLLDKILRILVEGLIDTLLSLFDEHRDTDIRILDINGFCQLMLELEYFETILNKYFTPDASESLKSLQGVILEKATESSSEANDTPKHRHRATRGSDDLLGDDKQGTVSPDELIALAQQCSHDLLQSELKRTQMNTACFVESLSLYSDPATVKAAAYGSFRGLMDSPSRSFGGKQGVGSPSFSRPRRR
ncbi:exocyst complex component SEC5A-like [Rutidosis leptorrhynchoides]|uniref:exocyst complex component SEC5A-like n=1 Tax=Rutidosis leptorrhynchoides TaxID=125765 RepID=UPI003A995C2A